MSEPIELWGKDNKNGYEFFVAWSLNQSEIVKLKDEHEKLDENNAYTYFIVYSADGTV